jgi:hypothetical protein
MTTGTNPEYPGTCTLYGIHNYLGLLVVVGRFPGHWHVLGAFPRTVSDSYCSWPAPSPEHCRQRLSLFIPLHHGRLRCLALEFMCRPASAPYRNQPFATRYSLFRAASLLSALSCSVLHLGTTRGATESETGQSCDSIMAAALAYSLTETCALILSRGDLTLWSRKGGAIVNAG